MKVLEKSFTKAGIKVQLEKWEDGLQIGAYPIAKNSTWIIKAGEPFRLTIAENKYKNYTSENVKADFESLKSGEKSLEILSKYFWYGEKDMALLGMI